MTVSTATSRIEYTGDAVTTIFSFPYYFLANGDLKVYLDGVLQTITTHYTVAGAGVPAGGTVTFLTAPPTADVVVIYREVAITQSVDYTPNDPFPANTHEQALDRLTMIAQQLDEEAGRALALPSTSTYSDLTLPDPQANYYLQWKEDLSGLKNVAVVSPGALSVSPYIETLLNDADAATARTTLGGVATLTGIETLTNKTLTTPTINTPTLTSPVLNGTLSGTAFLDEDTMVSDSAIAVPSQQSVKAYVDARAYKTCRLEATGFTATTGTLNTLTWSLPATCYDPYGFFDIANPTRITVPTGVSKMKVSVTVRWTYSSAGSRIITFSTTGTFLTHGMNVDAPASAFGLSWSDMTHCSTLTPVTPGHIHTVQVGQSSGGNLVFIGAHITVEAI